MKANFQEDNRSGIVTHYSDFRKAIILEEKPRKVIRIIN